MNYAFTTELCRKTVVSSPVSDLLAKCYLPPAQDPLPRPRIINGNGSLQLDAQIAFSRYHQTAMADNSVVSIRAMSNYLLPLGLS